MKSLFLISTSLQLLNAIEAQNYFKTIDNTLVLFYYGNHNKDHSQIEKLLSRFDYDELIIFDVSNKKKYLNMVIGLIKKLKLNSYNYVFTGFFSANFRRFIANIKYDKLFLIDDGVYSISIHNELYNDNCDFIGYIKYITQYSEQKRNTKFKQLKFEMYHFFRKVYLRANGCKNDMDVMNLNFFTIFNLPQYKDEIIVKNNLNSLKSNYEITHKQNSTIYFLGQPLCKAVGMSCNEYLSLVESIFKYYIERKNSIIYIPHRSEEEVIIESIKKMNLNNIKVIIITMPFELYVLENDINVESVASFVSTALFSIKILYPSANVDTFKFSSDSSIDKTNLLIYEALNKHGINAIELNNKI